ncbi:MAG: anti-sigma factor family protein [Candidatus Eiseniibacteriota bacterium]
MSGECGKHFDCRKVHELLGDYLDQELRDALCRELETHLERCPDCRVHVDSVRQVIRLYREGTATSLPVDIRIRLQDLLRRERDRHGDG